MKTKPYLTAIGQGHRWRHRTVTLGLMIAFVLGQGDWHWPLWLVGTGPHP